MKQGLMVGSKQMLKVEVTPAMFAQFEGKVVHPVYSTAMMVYHMEWVSRLIILPFLENEEEGMGAEVSVKHLSPAPVGSELDIQANVVSLKKNVIVTNVQVKAGERMVGTGEVTQVVLAKSKINRLISDK
ncbi:thioesterase family protein [Sutcliffiella halmapala]|uniref:thioesterase family protein n=1 Tax=Sutcliffiella halmapala TaxID=79882 RepID=UPI0009957ED6|nr:hotdog domain-containing protein [Sutcliffiella halmapala]